MRYKTLSTFFLLLSLIIVPLGSFADTEKKDLNIKVDVNKEDKEVGLKRMELIDKSLSRDLMERKRKLVKSLESDYNNKIITFLNSLIPPVFRNKVITHIDVNYFAWDFETQVHASQKVSVALIIKSDGFNTWLEQNTSREAAEEKLKQLISGTFKISKENISLVIVN